MLSQYFASTCFYAINSRASHREIDISFFVITVDLWDEEAQKEVNLVKHAANSPSISTASAVAYPQTPTANVLKPFSFQSVLKLTNGSLRHNPTTSTHRAITLRPPVPNRQAQPVLTTLLRDSKDMLGRNLTTGNMVIPLMASIIRVLDRTTHSRMVNTCMHPNHCHPVILRTW